MSPTQNIPVLSTLTKIQKKPPYTRSCAARKRIAYAAYKVSKNIPSPQYISSWPFDKENYGEKGIFHFINIISSYFVQWANDSEFDDIADDSSLRHIMNVYSSFSEVQLRSLLEMAEQCVNNKAKGPDGIPGLYGNYQMLATKVVLQMEKLGWNWSKDWISMITGDEFVGTGLDEGYEKLTPKMAAISKLVENGTVFTFKALFEVFDEYECIE